MRRKALITAALSVSLLATAARAELVTGHVVPDAVVSRQAPLVAPAAPDRVLTLELSLPLRNEAALDRFIGQLQDPASPAYRHYLTPAAFAAAYAPSVADTDAVAAFARAQGLSVGPGVPNRRFVAVTGTVAVVERALHVRMGMYRHPTEHRLFIAPDREPTLDLAVPVLAVTGLDDFTSPVARIVRGRSIDAMASQPRPPGGSGPKGQFIGSDMRAAYYGHHTLAGAGQSVGLFELGGYDVADVQRYFASLGQSLSVPIEGVSVGGASLDCSHGCDDSEQVLDIEEAIAMAPRLDRVVVYVGDRIVPLLNRMATDAAALQLSCSWGWAAQIAADEPIFKQFIAQGESFLVATGDDGYQLLRGAVWPADDTYVTSVGGTNLHTAGPGGAWRSEVGWRYSGGGPSPDGVPIPADQVPFVTRANAASATARNVPDIAAEADTNNYSCYDGICVGGSGGTSYAAPRWAGFLALANEAAAEQGKPPIGFLNPTIYALGGSLRPYAAAFHDQVGGYNGRYYATPRFDLVTGFGSPTGLGTIAALVGR